MSHPDLQGSLARALQAFPQPPAHEAAHDLPEFWKLANVRGVAVLLASVMPSAPREMKDLVRVQAGVSIRLRGVLGRLLKAFEKAQIPVVALKGPLLAERLYPEAHLRPSGDLDLLVPSGKFEDALQLLKEHGGALIEDYEANRASHDRFNHHLGVSFHGTLVELHWRPSAHFGAQLSTDELFARSTSAEVLGARVRRLEPHDELLFLAQHAASHMYHRDILLLDLRRMFEVEKLDWRTLEARAGAYQVARSVAAALLVAHQRVGLDVSGMPSSWRALGEDLFRARAWSLGVVAATTSWEALKNAVVEGIWADSPLLGASSVAERLLFGVRRRLAATLKGARP